MARPATTARVNSDLDNQSPAADLVRVYLNGIGKTALLTAADEVELAKRIEAGLYAKHVLETKKRLSPAKKRDLAIVVREGQAARSHLLEANLRLVVSLAKRYTGRGMPLLDLIQEATSASSGQWRSSTMRRASSSPPTPRGGSVRPSPAAWPIRAVPSGSPSTSSSRSTSSPGSSGNCTSNSAARHRRRTGGRVRHPGHEDR